MLNICRCCQNNSQKCYKEPNRNDIEQILKIRIYFLQNFHLILKFFDNFGCCKLNFENLVYSKICLKISVSTNEILKLSYLRNFFAKNRQKIIEN